MHWPFRWNVQLLHPVMHFFLSMLIARFSVSCSSASTVCSPVSGNPDWRFYFVLVLIVTSVQSAIAICLRHTAHHLRFPFAGGVIQFPSPLTVAPLKSGDAMPLQPMLRTNRDVCRLHTLTLRQSSQQSFF